MNLDETTRDALASRTTMGDGSTLAPMSVRVPCLTLLAHPDPGRVGEQAPLPALSVGRSLYLSRAEPSFLQPSSTAGTPRALEDPHLSRKPLVLEATGEGWRLCRAGSSTHTEVDGRALVDAVGFSAADLERGVVLELGRRIVLVLHFQHPTPVAVPKYGLVGESSAMVEVRLAVRQLASLPASVLVRGETGTGKELVARALHAAGERRRQPYLSVNLAAVPSQLAAAQLFGARKGAYTGADRDQDGYFRRAHLGTLFLDEVGETPADVQALLLRALESGEIQPVGSTETRQVDVRVVTATDADLEAAIAAGDFRAPLLHRLAGFEIRLPPLRDRRSDLGRLLMHFLEEELRTLGTPELLAAGAGGKPWPSSVLVASLARHSWPGNVRELRNAARRLAALGRGTAGASAVNLMTQLLGQRTLVPDGPGGEGSVRATAGGAVSVEATSSGELPAGNATAPPARRRLRKIEDVGHEEMLQALRDHQWQVAPAAAALGVSRATLYRLIETVPGIRKAAELEAVEIEAALEQAGGVLEAAAAALEVSPQGLKRRLRALDLADAGPGPGTGARRRSPRKDR